MKRFFPQTRMSCRYLDFLVVAVIISMVTGILGWRNVWKKYCYFQAFRNMLFVKFVSRFQIKDQNPNEITERNLQWKMGCSNLIERGLVKSNILITIQKLHQVLISLAAILNLCRIYSVNLFVSYYHFFMLWEVVGTRRNDYIFARNVVLYKTTTFFK